MKPDRNLKAPCQGIPREFPPIVVPGIEIALQSWVRPSVKKSNPMFFSSIATFSGINAVASQASVKTEATG